jgi:DNA uptake protein ComE-like DNA-binding protein
MDDLSRTIAQEGGRPMRIMNLQLIPLTIALVFASSCPIAYAESGVLNANTATTAEISSLPHMDDVLAEAVVKYRPYATIADLDERLSADLDDDQLEALYLRLFVPINLNTAARADILLIPGVGERMAHEFEEYRPYSSIEQFRREIGKYVDAAEVARLEQYVILD